MKRNLLALASLLALALAVSATAIAENVAKHVIAVKTDDFELVETDISDLEIGEARTIVTEDGKNIDIIRAAEGVEIYVDGELMDLPFEDTSGIHKHRKHMIMDCDDSSDNCQISSDHEVLIKETHVACDSDDESGCVHDVRVTDHANASFGDVEIEKLIDSDSDVRVIHIDGEGHELDVDNIDVHELREVIVVREEAEE